MNQFDFSGQTVVVTGAASGIGAAQAAAFKAAGAQVIGVDLQPMTGVTVAIQADVSDPETGKKLAADYTPDIVCNTAGILDGYKTVAETDLATWQHILNVDLTSQFLMIKALLPGMLARGHGVFVNMSSIAGRRRGVYCRQARCHRPNQATGSRLRCPRYPRQRPCPRRHQHPHERRRFRR